VKDLDRNEQVMVAVADLARHLRGD